MDFAALDAFYRATTFVVRHPGGEKVAIRIGREHPGLDSILPPEVTCWAFLTPCNPRSKVLAEADNRERLRSMQSALRARAYRFWPGLGVSDAGDWEPEVSVLVLGMPCTESDRIAELYEQNAYVFGERGGPAALIWTDSGIRAARG